MRFSVLEEEISKIRHHIRHGESKKALELIAKIEKRELSDEDRDNLNLHKAEVLPSYGKHVEAMELIEKLIKKFQREKLSKKYITALSQKVWLLIGSSQLDNALNLIKKINELIKSLPNEKLDEFYMERYSVLLAKGAANYYKGNYKQHAKFAKKALKLAEKYNFEHGIGVALINLHESHRMFENKEIAYDYLEEAMRIFRKHKNQYRIAYIEHYYGHKYAQEMNYDKAIESYLKIMPFIKQSENAYQRIAILLHLSNAYYHNLEYDISFDYDTQAYNLLEKTVRLDVKELIIRNMINWSIDREEDEKADEYLREFKEVLQQLNRPNIELVLQTFEIKKRMRDYNKEKNSKLREETEIIIMNWLTDASEKNISIMNAELQLCTLLLDEYIETGNNKLIQEIESRTSILLDKLKVEGREIPRIAILAYRLMVLWLRSRIQNDKKRSSEIEHLLSKTEEYAGVKGNKLLLKYLKDQREKYASIIEELEEIVEKYIESH